MKVAVAFDHRGVKLVRSFPGARFDGGERYVRRLEKIAATGREQIDG
jgi:hypothetical protein